MEIHLSSIWRQLHQAAEQENSQNPYMTGEEGVWDRKLLEDEVLELIRMKNIIFPDQMELVDAKKRVYEAYGETPPKN